jgi:hypothetical protein
LVIAAPLKGSCRNKQLLSIEPGGDLRRITFFRPLGESHNDPA